MVNFTILAAGYSTVFSLFTFVPPSTSGGNGSLVLEGTFPAGNNASWIQRSAVNPSVIYAANENVPTGSVVSFTLSDSGVPTKVDEVSSEGADPPYAASFGDDGKEVLIVNYNGGNARFIPTLPNSLTEFNENQTQTIVFPAPNRTDGVSHPHFFNTFGSEVFIADLGADQIWRLSKAPSPSSASPRYKITGSIPQPFLSGPRRFVTLPSPLNASESYVYTLHELANSFTVQRVPESPKSGVGGDGGGEVLGQIITVPNGVNPNDSNGGVWHAAELLWAESTSPLETLFYISNRNTNNTSPNGDQSSIIIVSAIFSPGTSGSTTGKAVPKLETIFSIDTGLNQIRGMELSASVNATTSSPPSSPGSDNTTVGYLAAAGEVGGGVKIFARTDGGRKLVPVASYGLEGINPEQPLGAQNITTFLWL